MVSRICSQKSDLDLGVKKLKNWFSKRRYSEKKVIREQVNTVLRSEKNVKKNDGRYMK